MVKETDVARLARLRFRRDLSYQALAAEIGIAPQTLWNYLNGKAVFARTAHKIKTYLDTRRSVA